MSAGARTNVAPVLVVGGGIGGLAAALALARGGNEVLLLEQEQEFAEVGAGIQLGPNATRALAALGVLDAVLASAVEPRQLVMKDAVDGRPLTTLDLGAAFRARYAAPYVVLHRHDLLSALLEACHAHPRISLQTRRSVTGWRALGDGGGVSAECADGSRHDGRALVGADGLRSVIRRSFSNDEPDWSGYVAYRGPVPIARVMLDVSLDAVTVWIGPDLHLVQYPLRGGKLYNQVAVFRTREPRDADDLDLGGPDELLERFGAMCGPVAQSVGLLDHGPRWRMSDRPAIDRWSAGSCTLLGDAAHPMLQYLAQGGCQALEDAVQIGLELRPDRPAAEAMRDYESQRIPRTARVQRSARSWGELWHLKGVAREVRNRYLRLRAADDYADADWLYGGGPA